MSNKTSFNDFFPTDNSSRTNLKYDLVASKFMTGVENHQRNQYNNSASVGGVFILISAFFQIFFGLILIIFGLLRNLYKSLR
ncbi:hypothetical protein [Flavobacterium sp. NRK F7]|uniref:hypothetical protein n=1 Tax=Flavobacterium sp. NRK F7 TaxID=2954930 RepID=UPI0020903FD6|nr:hypothetical protein [Flavobacterium sp. NRK F7]MCO6163957.1 hypothetical protein [Flavobacterium sp. NRK F7]